jgi:hypothetical protein
VKLAVPYFVMALLVGCAPTSELTTFDSLEDNEHDILVTRTDSTTIHFDDGEYTVESEGDSARIEGTGMLKSAPDGVETPFQGKVMFGEIQKIETVSPSVGTQLLTPVVGTLVLGLVIAIFALDAQSH